MASYCCYPCELCAKGCSACSRSCSGGCDGLCKNGCCPIERPSPIFLSWSVLMNAVTGVAAVVIACLHIPDWGSCYENLGMWLLVQALVFNLFMCLFAWRLYALYSVPYERDNPTSRAGRVCWKEPLVCAMFISAPCAFGWACTGIVWATSSATSCPEPMVEMAVWSGSIMIVYLFLSWIPLSVSLCVECGRFSASRSGLRAEGRYGGPAVMPPQTGGDQPAPTAPPQQQPPPPPQGSYNPNMFEKIGADFGKVFYPSAPPYYVVQQQQAASADPSAPVYYPEIYGQQQPAVGHPVGSSSGFGYVPPINPGQGDAGTSSGDLGKKV